MAEARFSHELDLTINCCNGRVGHHIMEMAEKRKDIRELIVPTGVELLKVAVATGIRAKDVINCCNGKVGKRPVEELISILGGN